MCPCCALFPAIGNDSSGSRAGKPGLPQSPVGIGFQRLLPPVRARWNCTAEGREATRPASLSSGPAPARFRRGRAGPQPSNTLRPGGALPVVPGRTPLPRTGRLSAHSLHFGLVPEPREAIESADRRNRLPHPAPRIMKELGVALLADLTLLFGFSFNQAA